MTQATVYNATVGAATAMIGVGTGAEFGWPLGLVAAGAVMLVLSARMLRGR